MHPRSKTIQQPFRQPVGVLPPQKLVWHNPTDQQVYGLLKEHGPLTRDQLVKMTGFPRTTVFDALTRLSVRGLISRFAQPRPGRGRRRVFFEVTA